jgi:hypothetical protein
MFRSPRALSVCLLALLACQACDGAGADPEIVAYTTEDVRVDSSGAADAGEPAMCVAGTTVYVVWHDDRRGGRNQVFFNAGRAGGSTWGSDEQISGDPTGTSVAENPTIACAGESVYLAWEDDRDSDLGHRSIYFRQSDDSGRTWNSERLLTADLDGDWDSLGPALSVVDDGTDRTVYLVWYDNRRGAYDIYFTRGLNGVDWLAEELRLDTDAPGAAYSAHPLIVTDDIGGLYVSWQDARHGGNDVYVRHSATRGDFWDVEDTRLTGGEAGAVNAFGISMVIDREATQPAIYVAWHDDRHGARDIFLASSTNAGFVWTTEPQRVEADGEGAADSFYPSVSAAAGRVMVAWHDNRDGGFDILVRTSLNGGDTWGSEFRVDTDVVGTAHSLRPQVVQEGERVAVGWIDHRTTGSEFTGDPQPDVYYRVSPDGGLSWASDDRRVDDDPQSSAISDDLQIRLAGPAVHALWVDYRQGNADLWYRRMPSFLQEE